VATSVTALPIPEPKNHEPSGRPSWPRILLSGEEGAHKSWELARLSADKRLGGMFWLEVGAGESTAEEYGAIQDVKYRIIDHDGTFTSIYGQLRAHRQLAQKAEDAGEPPIALGLDSFTGVWSMLTSWVDLLARRREAEKAERFKRPVRTDLWSAEFTPQITPDLWNLANRRWDMIMEIVQTWPGPVGYTAREKQVTVFKDNGQPDPKQPKVWTLEAQKGLGFASSAWVRLTRDDTPQVVKLRSVRQGNIKIFQDTQGAPVPWSGEELDLAELIFDVIGCEAGVSRAPDVKTLDADQVLPGEEIEPTSSDPAVSQPRSARPARRVERDWDAEIEKCGDNRDALLKLWREAPEGEIKERILKLGKELKAKEEAAAAEPMPEVVDGEIVEDPAAETVAIENPNQAKLFDALLDASSWGQVEAISKQITSNVKFARADVSVWLKTQPIMARLLEVNLGEPLTLSEMSSLVAIYVDDKGHSLNDGIDGSTAAVA
jgi:hypothetical protein